MSLVESSEPDPIESSELDPVEPSLVPVDNAKLMTSINLISVCFAIIIYLKKLTAEPNILVIISLSIAILLFIGSAIFSFFAMICNSCGRNQIKNHLSTPQSITYLLGLVFFAYIAFMVIIYS